jgi:hypothetical protein
MQFQDTFKRFVLIGSTIFSNKLVLILTAYFFTQVQYNIFNKAYYTASILILFGVLGFDFAVSRMKIDIKNVIIGVLVNVMLTFVVLHLISQPFENPLKIFSVLIYSIFACLGGIFTFQLLFKGEIKSYVILMLTNAFFHLLIIPFVTFMNADIYLLLPFVTAFWFLIGYPQFKKLNTVSGEKLASLYKLGISTFIINSAVSLALVADKYIVNHYFPLETANAYTFAWGLIVPLLYIGNVVEKLIYSSTSGDSFRIFNKSLLVLLMLVASYSALLLLAVNFVPALMPKAIDLPLLREILNFMMIGYALFVVFNFPVNGFLFKFAQTSKQKIIAVAYTAAILVFPFAFFLVNGSFAITDYHSLLLLVWLFIFILLITKSVVIFLPVKKTLAL